MPAKVMAFINKTIPLRILFSVADRLNEIINPLSESVKDAFKLLHHPAFSVKDSPFTYRTVNHYEEKGLLRGNRKAGLTWRLFSGFDLIWLLIIEELRRFGFPLSSIKELKQNLFFDGKYGTIDKAMFINRPYEVEIADACVGGFNLYLVVFASGSFTFYDSQTKSQWESASYNDDSHISIPLRPMISQVWRQVQQTEL